MFTNIDESSVAKVGGSCGDKVVQKRGEKRVKVIRKIGGSNNNSRVKLVQITGGAGKRGQISRGGNLFEVRNSSKAFKVDESLRTCSCRIWKLSRITCTHAVAVIFKLNRWAEDYLPDYFRKEMHIQAYSQYLTPVDGMSFWPECGESSIILPPKPKTMLL
nr:pentatricopeptide repeat-containing protein [Tanacetum cinerariifolium]